MPVEARRPSEERGILRSSTLLHLVQRPPKVARLKHANDLQAFATDDARSVPNNPTVQSASALFRPEFRVRNPGLDNFFM